MIRRIAIIIVSIAALAALAAPPASGSGTGKFIITCAYDHSLADDPIVYPGAPGASHLHDFFGNKTTNAYSTADSMTGKATTCNNAGDTAGYWVPATFINGKQVLPTSLKAYYYKKFSTGTVAFPHGFAMIAGNKAATGPQSTSVVYYGCGNGSGLSKVNYLPDCTGKGHFTVHVLFPFCQESNGTLTYNTGCTGTRFPQLVERIDYKNIIDARGVSLSSGPFYTMHADFLNAWNQTELQRLVAAL